LESLVAAGIGKNSRRAMESDLRYLESWSLAATGSILPWPPSLDLVLKFVAHHFWSPELRDIDPDHGMPPEVEGVLRDIDVLKVEGPHAISTIRRRLSHWRSFCEARSVPHPFDEPLLRKTLRMASRAKQEVPKRKSARSVNLDIISALQDSLEAQTRSPDLDPKDVLRAYRDNAILSIAFFSGGRRRSEVAKLELRDFIQLDPVPAIDRPDQEIPAMAINLGRTKTSGERSDQSVIITGRTIEILREWLSIASIASGPVFRSINRWGQLGADALNPYSINMILKDRLTEIGYDRMEFSAHGIRSGFITSAIKKGIPLQEVMTQSTHRSLKQASRYFNDIDAPRSNAAQLDRSSRN
jgi:integrase